MIVGIGFDIVDHSTTKKLKWNTDEITQSRIFSQRELLLNTEQKAIIFLSGRFAAKEAILKCLGCGMQDGIDLTEIEILRGKLGKPEITLKGQAKKISNKKGIGSWQVTISHSKNNSAAFVVAEAKIKTAK
jgi:holo-[acyl-carrier protein] synthase